MSSSRAYALMQYAVLRAHEQGNSTEHNHTLTRITGQHCISLDIIWWQQQVDIRLYPHIDYCVTKQSSSRNVRSSDRSWLARRCTSSNRHIRFRTTVTVQHNRYIPSHRYYTITDYPCRWSRDPIGVIVPKYKSSCLKRWLHVAQPDAYCNVITVLQQRLQIRSRSQEIYSSCNLSTSTLSLPYGNEP